MYDKIKDKMCFVYKVLIAICLVLMVLANVAQVICRYFISYSLIWAEDFSIYLLHWAVCFSAPLLWILHEHMVMDVANGIFPKKLLTVLDYVIDIVGIYFGLVLSKKGFYAAKVNKGYIMSVMGYEETWKYVPYGICGILLAIAAGMSLYERIRKLVKEKKGVNE